VLIELHRRLILHPHQKVQTTFLPRVCLETRLW